MSLINQVLNELENRGVNVPLGEATIRPVPPRKQTYLMRYAFLALTILILLAVAKWYLARTDIPVSRLDTATTHLILPVTTSGSAVSSSISAPMLSTGITPSSSVSLNSTQQISISRREKPLLEVKSEERPDSVSDVKKSVRNKSQQITKQVTQNGDNQQEVSSENLQFKKISPLQRAENEFQKANLAVQEGRTNDALAGYEAALLIDSTFKAARRAWVGVLISLKRHEEAERVLQRGIKRDPKDTSFATLLARLQVERNDIPLALETLLKVLPYADNQPEFQAFLAALLQRQSRHEEAVTHYQVALKLVPDNGIWWMGLGMSLQVEQRKEDARDAYQRALATKTLSPQLQAFVLQKLKDL